MTATGDLGHTTQTCESGASALVRAFNFLGKRWNGLLLGNLVMGPMGYADLKRAVVGIGDSVLSERLSELCRAGLVQRIVEEGPPVSVLYQVTPAGQALLPVLEALVTWAQENLPA